MIHFAKAFPYLFAVLAGAGTALQAVINSQARHRLEIHPLQATLINFSVGTILIILICLAAGFAWPSGAAFARAPWWIWTGGVLGILFVSASVVLTPMLGVTVFLILILAGQLVGSLLLDQFGTLGTPVRPATLGRILGAVIVIIGVIVMAWTTPAAPAPSPTEAYRDALREE